LAQETTTLHGMPLCRSGGDPYHYSYPEKVAKRDKEQGLPCTDSRAYYSKSSPGVVLQGCSRRHSQHDRNSRPHRPSHNPNAFKLTFFSSILIGQRQILSEHPQRPLSSSAAAKTPAKVIKTSQGGASILETSCVNWRTHLTLAAVLLISDEYRQRRAT
jgi:hypothetical protein